MDLGSAYSFAYVQRSHGLKGHVVVRLDVDQPEDYAAVEQVWIDMEGTLVPFFADSWELKGLDAIVKLEEVDDAAAAKDLVGQALYLSIEELPPLTAEDQYYYHELVGLTAVDRTRGPLGKITAIYEAGRQDLLAIDHQGKEVLVPIQDDIVLAINRQAAQLQVDLPEGLLEIYTHED